MGISENTVEKHLGKALRMLLKLCGRERPEGQQAAPRPKADRNVRRA
jgi:hypothetical protein